MTDVPATPGYYQRHRGDVKLDDDTLSELRPGQRGAVFAMRSWATAPDDGVAAPQLEDELFRKGAT